MFSGNMEFLVGGVTVHLYDFHAVKQRARYPVAAVCGCDEKHLRQINGYLHIMIPERMVLLPVEHLQQRGRGISLVIAAEFINSSKSISGF